MRQIEILLKDVEADFDHIAKNLAKAGKEIAQNHEGNEYGNVVKRLETEVSKLKEIMAKEISVDEMQHTALYYLKRILASEYEGIFEYQSHARHTANERISDTFKKFCSDETEHAKMLVHEIRKLGGIPRVEIGKNTIEGEFKLNDLLDMHEKGEKESIKLLEEAQKQVHDSEYSYLFGKILLEEKDHLRVIKELRKEHANDDIFVNIKNHIADQPMEEDRPWVDG